MQHAYVANVLAHLDVPHVVIDGVDDGGQDEEIEEWGPAAPFRPTYRLVELGWRYF